MDNTVIQQQNAAYSGQEDSREDNDSGRRTVLLILLLLIILFLLFLYFVFIRTRGSARIQQGNGSGIVTVTATPSQPNSNRRGAGSTGSAGSNLDSQQTASSKITIEFSGPSQLSVQDSLRYDLTLTPGSLEVSAVELYITFDPTLLDIQEFRPSQAYPIVLKKATIGAGTVEVTLGASPSSIPKGPVTLGTLVGKPKKVGMGIIQIESRSRAAALTYRDYISISSVPSTVKVY